MKKKARINLKNSHVCSGCGKRKREKQGLYFSDVETFTCFECIYSGLNEIQRLEQEFEAFKAKIFELASETSIAYWQQCHPSVMKALDRYLLAKFQDGAKAEEVIRILEHDNV